MEQNSRHSQRKCLIRVKVSARSDFTHQQTCGGGTPVIWVCETGSVSVIIRRQFTECGSHLPHPPWCLSQSSTLAEATRSLLLLLVMNEEAACECVQRCDPHKDATIYVHLVIPSVRPRMRTSPSSRVVGAGEELNAK